MKKINLLTDRTRQFLIEKPIYVEIIGAAIILAILWLVGKV